MHIFEKKSLQLDKEKELKNITFVKAILMLIVVVGHASAFWSGSWFPVVSPAEEAPILNILFEWVGSFHIYGFTLASGYLFSYIINEKRGYNHFGDLLKNKFKRLIVPYYFVAIIYVIPISCYFFELSRNDVIQSYLLGTAPSQLWFLWMLFDVFIIAWLLNGFIKNNDKLGLCLVLAIYALGVGGNMITSNYFQIWTACRYLLFFWIGYKIRQHGSSNILFAIPPIGWIVLDVAIFIVMKNIPNEGFFSTILLISGDLILYSIGAIMSFVVLQRSANLCDWSNNKLFTILKDRSMPVYLFHQQIIYFSIISLNGVVSAYVHAFLNFVIAIIVALIISSVLISNKYSRFLVGEK